MRLNIECFGHGRTRLTLHKVGAAIGDKLEATDCRVDEISRGQGQDRNVGLCSQLPCAEQDFMDGSARVHLVEGRGFGGRCESLRAGASRPNLALSALIEMHGPFQTSRWVHPTGPGRRACCHHLQTSTANKYGRLWNKALH